MSDLKNTTLIATAIVAALPLIPVLHFLAFGWETRRQQIVSRFSDASIENYKAVCCPKSEFTTWEEFARDYDLRYGRHLFLFPVMLFIAAVIFLSHVGVSLGIEKGVDVKSTDKLQILIFSLAGGYLWIVNDLIIRARQTDMVTSDINRAVLRLFIAVPLGYAISAPIAAATEGTVTQTTAAALAFFVGAFPTETILKFMRRTAGTALKLDADAGGGNVRALTTIDGISVPIAERFIDEGVNTIPQLAYVDPVRFTIRTGMDFSFILDCAGQALVAMYFAEADMAKVRKFGLRTNLEVFDLDAALSSNDPAINGPAMATLNAFAADLGMVPDTARFIIDQIAHDPYTAFVSKIW